MASSSPYRVGRSSFGDWRPTVQGTVPACSAVRRLASGDSRIPSRISLSQLRWVLATGVIRVRRRRGDGLVQTNTHGVGGGLRAGGDSEFGEDVRDVGFGGAGADEQ